MKDEYLFNNLILEMQRRFIKSPELVSKLIDILSIEKEAIYRRLRKEVPFSFAEVVAISKDMGISLDHMIGFDNKHKRSAFQLQMTDFIEAEETDYLMMNEYVEIYRLSKGDKTSEMATSSNIIPQTIFAGFPALRHFYLFKWNYHYENNKSVKTFHDLVIPERVIQLYDEQFIVAKNIAVAYHILDHMLFLYLVNDIKYFHSINLIRSEDVKKIKEDLLKLLNYLEMLAITGIYEETNNKVYLYISDLNIDSNYFYLQTTAAQFSLLNAFILNSASSLDRQTLDQMKSWVNSIVRISNLITVTGEKQRSLFFTSQRKYIDQL